MRQTPSIPDGSRRPTTATRVPTRYVEPLALTDVKDAGLVPCVAPFCTLLVAAGGGALALSVGDTPELPQRSAAKASARAPQRVYLKDGGGFVDLFRGGGRLYADSTGAVIAHQVGMLFFVSPDGETTTHSFPRPIPQASRRNLALSLSSL